MFGGFLGETVEFVHACDEHIEILESLTYFSGVVHSSKSFCQEVFITGVASLVMESVNTGFTLSLSVQKN